MDDKNMKAILERWGFKPINESGHVIAPEIERVADQESTDINGDKPEEGSNEKYRSRS